MTTVLKYLLLLTLYLCCYSANAADNTGFVVGNNAGVVAQDQTSFAGPNGDARVVFRYATSTNNLVFYKPTQLGPTGVKLYWSQLDTASGGNGFLYCTKNGNASGGPMDIKNTMKYSGKLYGGHKLFETSVPGLYYTLVISNIWSAYNTITDIPSSGMYIGDASPQFFYWRITDRDLQYWGCDNANSTKKYWAIGGVYQSLTVEFYTDTNFDPTVTQQVSLSRSGDYLYAFWANGAGVGINEYSYYIKIDFDLQNIKLTNPTCFTAAVTGTSVSGSTVKMGEYSSQQIKNGASPVPFDISLQNCVRVRNIETKLVTGKVGTENKQLLGNTLTGSTAAKGVGVLIEGLVTSKNPLMTLKPNDATSIYKDYETEDDTSDGVYPNQGSGTSQPLHFQATLKQDGNIAIESGEFKATSTFQVTYP